MLNAIEGFSRDHQYSIALLGAVSTLAAVVTSLVLALLGQRSYRTRLRAHISLKILLHDMIDRQNPPSYLTADITNKGLQPLRIPFAFFHWRIPFNRGSWIVNPHDYSATDPWIAQQKYPVEIAPRASHTFFVSSKKMFWESLSTMMAQNRVSKWQFRFLRVTIISDDGKRFRGQLSKGLRKEIAEARKVVSRE